jgi:hypothetical protein
MQELFRAIPELIGRFKDNDQVLSAFVFTAWRRTAGEMLRERTEPLEYSQKRLTLAVENTTWKRHLEDLSGDMLYRLNAALGQGVVTFIEFRVDQAAVRKIVEEKDSPRTGPDPTQAVSPSLRRAAEAIRDERLREQFIDAAGAYLSRQND